ncbi:NLI interacting factor-like phosphatase domain-containing protein [Ditylenchus destructor]|nr:NLI interacting factor-like phosphatase domain-containing protein [Ditylenchus destructor]
MSEKRSNSTRKDENATSDAQSSGAEPNNGDKEPEPKRERKVASGEIASAGNNEGPCDHPLTIKDLCAVCGRDLREKGGLPGQRVEAMSANVSMIHHVPELLVSNKLAKEIGQNDRETLLKNRKLVLMVDLDQTLIHTSNRPPKPAERSSAIVGYRIYNSCYFTKIRPHTREFLERMNQLYEMHIVTFGQRVYAHKITGILDPEGRYFHHRILSRDELMSSIYKTRNIKALFPVGDELVVMIDDRPDVWQYSDALIRVKPYRYFVEIGDINAPPPAINADARDNGSKDDTTQPESTADTESSTSPTDPEKPLVSDEKVDSSETDNTNAEEESEVKSTKSNKPVPSKSVPASKNLAEPPPTIVDDDDTLEHIERILTSIHTQFYQSYDEVNTVKDVKVIIAGIRKQVLKDDNIVFTGLIPREIDPKQHWLYRTCEQFGAKIESEISDLTSILVAGRSGTDKMRQAKKQNIPIVTQDWLYACFYRWQRVDENDYLFFEESLKMQQSPNSSGISKKSLTGMGAERLSQEPILTRDMLRRMSNEVDDALSDEDEDSGDKDPDENDLDEDEAGDEENNDDDDSSDFDEMATDIENQLNNAT